MYIRAMHGMLVFLVAVGIICTVNSFQSSGLCRHCRLIASSNSFHNKLEYKLEMAKKQKKTSDDAVENAAESDANSSQADEVNEANDDVESAGTACLFVYIFTQLTFL